MPAAMLPLAAAAAVLAVLVPSAALAERSDLVLAVLVLLTALGIEPSQLLTLRARLGALAALVLVPFVLLVPLAWLISLGFSGELSDGLLALGVSSTEVAAVGLVALVGGSTVLALGALTGSLVLAALAGPVLLGFLAGADADVAVGSLVGRFSLVVLVPLVVGLAVRAYHPRLERVEHELAGLATLTLVALVYGAMSGAGEAGELLAAAAASALFLAATGLLVAVWIALAPRELRATGALVIELRDFAVAAALATQAFGTSAATVAGVYGVMMLLLGTAATWWLSRNFAVDAEWKDTHQAA